MVNDAKFKKINEAEKLVWQKYMKIVKKPLLLGTEGKKERRPTCRNVKAGLIWEQIGLAKGSKEKLIWNL